MPPHCFAAFAGTLNRSHSAKSRTKFDLPHSSGAPVAALLPKSSDCNRPPVPLPYSPRGYRLPTSPTHGMPVSHQRTSSVGKVEVSCCSNNKPSGACNCECSSCYKHRQPCLAVSKLALQWSCLAFFAVYGQLLLLAIGPAHPRPAPPCPAQCSACGLRMSMPAS